jgi:polyisoprenoid-binding protein YceI
VVYHIDPDVSRFTVRAFAGGLFSALAHNPTFAVRQYAGDVQFDGQTVAALTMTIQAPSLALTDDVSASDQREIERIMHQEILDDARFPAITYASPPAATTVTPAGSGQFTVALNGDISLHGVTRRQPITARLVATPGMLRAYGEFSFRQSDYGIALFSGAGGTIKVKDELKCAFDISARP